MTTRKNTQGAKDSPKGGTPEQSEVPISAADTGTDQQPTGGSDGDNPGAAADPENDAARKILMTAISNLGLDPVKILPTPTQIRFIRRGATVIDTIIHDGNLIAPGGTVFVSQAEYAGLLKAKAVADVDWDELEEEPF